MPVQNYPSEDSPATEPFEGIVELYYQLKGYITSSNKWFWYREPIMQQRGYQDIDVLAINEKESILVSVTINLDDKIRRNRNRIIKCDMVEKIDDFYERVISYLKNVQEYRWIINNEEREVKKVLAYANGKENLADSISNYFIKENIDITLLSSSEIFHYLEKRIPEIQKCGMKTNNQLLKLYSYLIK